jgi:acetylornithine deacetylase
VDAVVRLLADLVAIPSVNPMGRPDPADPRQLEGGVSRHVAQFCAERGLPCERVPIAPGRDNLLIRYDAPNARRTLLFDAHQDTVPVEGMTIDPFDPVVRDGRMYGRGSCDVKAGLAAMLTAVARLHAERPIGSASVVLACTVDEEFTHTGSSRLAVARPHVDLAIVAEPTRLDLVTCHKGAVRWKVVAHGVACHSSTPHLGSNAIYRMARVVSALAEHACELAGRAPHPVLGPPSLSVGRIEGGQSVNIVPDRCEIEIDRRLLPGEDPAAAPTAIRDALAARLGSLDGIEFLPPWVNMPALAPQVDDATLDALARAVQGVTGRRPAVGGVPFGTDAGPLGQSGLPCVVFGPGDIAQAHTKDEWIELDQVRAAAEIYHRMALELG